MESSHWGIQPFFPRFHILPQTLMTPQVWAFPFQSNLLLLFPIVSTQLLSEFSGSEPFPSTICPTALTYYRSPCESHCELQVLVHKSLTRPEAPAPAPFLSPALHWSTWWSAKVSYAQTGSLVPSCALTPVSPSLSIGKLSCSSFTTQFLASYLP